jgi:hypothetical protein
MFLIFSFIYGCGKQQQLKAKIFERRELRGNRLMIRYHYEVNGRLFSDSATIANVVIGVDSISITVDPSNPGKSIPDIRN